MQGHWLLARAGKRVLRPGGLGLTRQMLQALAIDGETRVVEFAPGMGVTAKMMLTRRAPAAYWGVERDAAAAERLRGLLTDARTRIVEGPAEQSGLPDGLAQVVFSEALLSMQNAVQKRRVFAEARRLLAPGGRYGIHEIAFTFRGGDEPVRTAVQAAIAREIHVGVQLLTRGEWVRLFADHGFTPVWIQEAPLNLLELGRLVSDEGWYGCLRIGYNLARSREIRQRVLAMRRLFRRYRGCIGAVAIVGQCQPFENLRSA